MKRPGALRALCVCLLAALHGLLAWTGTSSKSATYDETLHITGAYCVRYLDDYRLNPEDPLLFQRWASLGLAKGDLSPDQTDPAWAGCLDRLQIRWDLCSKALYGTQPAQDGGIGQRALNRARGWMAAVSAAVCALVGLWAWMAAGGGRLGTTAALLAAGLYALDPNFLGHGALVKNDVPITLCFVMAMVSLTACMKRAGWAGVAALAAATSLGLVVKFSGVLLLATVVGGLALRAMAKSPWLVMGRQLSTRWQRLVGAAGLSVMLCLCGYGAIWLSYGGRYDVSTDSKTHFSLDWERGYERYIREQKAAAEQGFAPGLMPRWDEVTLGDSRPGAVLQWAQWAMDRHVLPETWVKGFTYTYLSAMVRDGYLMGELIKTGSSTYFAWAALFKSPLGLMFGCVAAIVVWWRLRKSGDAVWGEWGGLTIGVIVGVYIFMAVRGGLNLGLRHMLPVYPVVMVGIGVMLARAWALRPALGRVLAAVTVVGIAAESGAAYPNGLAFFNAPAVWAQPVNLLSDSNIDWGQDLPQLAAWQKVHPGKTLWLAYFGTARPEAFGLKFKCLPGTAYTGVPTTRPFEHGGRPSGVWAVSASYLCGLYDSGIGRTFYLEQVSGQRPIAKLGGAAGSIWLFDFGPGPPTRPAARATTLATTRATTRPAGVVR